MDKVDELMSSKSVKLSVYMLQEGTKMIDVLSSSRTPREIPLSATLGFKAKLYVVEPQPTEPDWLGFLREAVVNPLSLRGSSPRAVLFLEQGGRHFAIPFGTAGRALINPEVVERNFGLRVALNTIDPSQLRSVDIKTLETLTLDSRHQVSRYSGLNAFSLDKDKDLLRAITGKPSGKDFGARITGRDSVSFRVKLNVSELHQLCQKLHDRFKLDTYKRIGFGWIDRFREVRDPKLLKDLDESLVDALNSYGLSTLAYLSPGGPIDWENVSSVRYRGLRRKSFSDLDIEDYLQGLRATRTDPITKSLLKTHKVRFCDDDNQPLFEWSVFDCLVYEVEKDDDRFVLTDGKWYRIDGSFAKEVRNYVDGLDARLIRFPTYTHANEGAFNVDAAVQSAGHLAALDQTTPWPKDANSGVEPCDLVSKEHHLIYVKRRASSAKLSHLFGQGGVGAETLLSDREYRKKVRKKLKEEFRDIIPLGRMDAAKYTIIYAIIDDSKMRPWPSSLPFFSQLHLKIHAERLRRLGFEVVLQRVLPGTHAC